METQDGVEVFESDIDTYLHLFCEENGIEDMTVEPNTRWTACLLYIQKHVFYDKSILKEKSKLSGYNNPNVNLNKSNCNRYDIDKVRNICDIYIYVCMLYNKSPSIVGFCSMTGIDDNTIHAWKNGDNRLSQSGSDIYEKLDKFNEHYYECGLGDGKRQPLGFFGVLKHRHGWESPYTGDNRQKQALTADALPQLNCTKSIDNSESLPVVEQ